MSGDVVYEDHVSDHPLFRVDGVNGMQLPIASGVVERDAEGRVVARVRVASAVPMIYELRAAFGDDQNFTLLSPDRYVSQDVAAPTIFWHYVTREVVAGTPFTLADGKRFALPSGIHAEVIGEAVGHYDGGRFRGTLQVTYHFALIDMTDEARAMLVAALGGSRWRAPSRGRNIRDLAGGIAIGRSLWGRGCRPAVARRGSPA